MKVEGAAVVIDQDDVDTDVMYPGRFLGILDDAEMATHLFEGLDPSLRDQLVGDTILVAGANFGTGSSRENVPAAMQRRRHPLRDREELRTDLPAQLHQPGPARAPMPGRGHRRPARLVDPGRGRVRHVEVDGHAFQAMALPSFMVELVGHGGLAVVSRPDPRLGDEARA